MTPHRLTALSAIACLAFILIGCSAQKNTPESRWWQAFNTRYNVYYNGSVAYINGSLQKEQNNRDNYMEIIPLYTVGNKNSRDIGASDFDIAIKKAEKAISLHSITRRPTWNKNRRKTARDIEWLNRREYNPFLWKAWMLMGRSQFYKADFSSAISTFGYMSRLYETQPAIYDRAQAWLAKSYIENGQLYEAQDIIRNIRRDSIHWRAQKEWNYTMTDYYLHTGEYTRAIPYLRQVIKQEMRQKQKAREYYLLGQLETLDGHPEQAYEAYRKAIRLNPPYQLAFNARIAETEVLAGQQSGKMIARLRRMARSDKNVEYVDQIYYAIGNIYLTKGDTAQAITNYELGNEKSTRSSVERGVLLVKLGNIYWKKDQFKDAQRCYKAAMGMMDRDRKDYQLIDQRSKTLDELVPYVEAVALQDSLLLLSTSTESVRNKAIDRVIAELKKQEKLLQKSKNEEMAEQLREEQEFPGSIQPPRQPAMMAGTGQEHGWYFYNPIAVQQGKIQFERIWGKRRNVDNWQRRNTTVVSNLSNNNPVTERENALMDSIAMLDETAQQQGQTANLTASDPHQRAYYLAQIPFSQNQKEASHAIIMDGLFHSGVILKDELNRLTLAERTLQRLLKDYPSYDKTDEALYHLWLLYSRKGQPNLAGQILATLKQKFPDSQWTKILTDPYFVQNARQGVEIEDSLYAATYRAFKLNRHDEVEHNVSLSSTRFPMGANRDKFIFIAGLDKLNRGDARGCLECMSQVVKDFPQSPLAETAGMILNGVQKGRPLAGAQFDLKDVWNQRTETLNQQDSVKNPQLSNERNTKFVFMLVYSPDSVQQNKLLYELARHNFTSYPVRDFKIEITPGERLNRMTVGGFRNFDEALLYARQLYERSDMRRLMDKTRPVIISELNLPLLGKHYSFDDYAQYYNKHFAALKPATLHLLTEPTEIVTIPTSTEHSAQDEQDVDNMLNGILVPTEKTEPHQGTVIPIDIEPTPQETSQPTGTTIIPSGNEHAQKTTDARDSSKTTENQHFADTTTAAPTAEKRQGMTVVVTEEGHKSGSVTSPNKNGSRTEIPTSAQESAETKTKAKQNIGQSKSSAPVTVPTQPTTIHPTLSNGADIIFDDDTAVPTKHKTPQAQDKRAKPHSSAPAPSKEHKTTSTKGETPATKLPKEKAEQHKKKDTQTFDLEDEYYDLDGF